MKVKLKWFKDVLRISIGYIFSSGSTLLMYTMLPIILTNIRNPQIAWATVMVMTICQIFIFWPIAANFVDTYGARKMSFVYASAFILGALLRFWSYFIDNMLFKTIAIWAMVLTFAIWYGSRYVDVYTLRTSPRWKAWIAFWILATFTGVWQLIANLLQPIFIGSTNEVYAPFVMIVGMIVFIILLFFVKSDLEPDPTLSFLPEGLESKIKTSLGYNFFKKYWKTFYRGRRFIKRGRDFPLIPLTTSFFSGMYYGSLFFIIPLYLARNPEYHSIWLEIGIYQIIGILVAICFWFIADKGKSTRNIMIGWSWILIGMLLLYLHPSIDIMIIVWIIIGLSDQFLYATSQHILARHDRDSANDGAYTQTRNIIANIGYMLMPLFRGLIIDTDFSLILQLFASIISGIALLGMIVAFYLFVVRDGLLNKAKHKKKWWEFVWFNK